MEGWRPPVRARLNLGDQLALQKKNMKRSAFIHARPAISKKVGLSIFASVPNKLAALQTSKIKSNKMALAVSNVKKGVVASLREKTERSEELTPGEIGRAHV